MRTVIIIAILRNRIPSICIFETVYFFRSDYCGSFMSWGALLRLTSGRTWLV